MNASGVCLAFLAIIAWMSGRNLRGSMHQIYDDDPGMWEELYHYGPSNRKRKETE